MLHAPTHRQQFHQHLARRASAGQNIPQIREKQANQGAEQKHYRKAALQLQIHYREGRVRQSLEGGALQDSQLIRHEVNA